MKKARGLKGPKGRNPEGRKGQRASGLSEAITSVPVP